MERNILRMALPASLGSRAAAERASQLEAFLSRRSGRKVEVTIARAYDALTKDVLAGRVDLAWAPPFVCARLEAMGARVALRGIRNGASTYRAALVCREGAGLTLDTLQGKTASWIDRDSIGGYLLPQALLRARKLDPERLFFAQSFAGSYRAALEAVAAGEADVTSIYAPPARPDRADTTGIPNVVPELASRFSVIGWTDEVPNDGVAISMSADPEAVGAIEQLLLNLNVSEEGAALSREVFQTEAFEPAPRMGYRSLYRVALASI